MKKPIGILTNNPLNIRYTPMNTWRGQTGSRKGFCEFDSLKNGYRAALVLLRNYIAHGHRTIHQIISRWAPASENNTKAYIRFVVAHFNGYDDDVYRYLRSTDDLTEVDAPLSALLHEMAWVMSLMECGYPKGFDYKDERLYVVENMRKALDEAVDEVFGEGSAKLSFTTVDLLNV